MGRCGACLCESSHLCMHVWRSDVHVRPLSLIFLNFAHVYSFAWVGGRHNPWLLCVEIRGQLGGVTSLLHHVGSRDETKFGSKHSLSGPAPYFVRQSLLELTAFSRLANQQHSPSPCPSPSTSYRFAHHHAWLSHALVLGSQMELCILV